MFINSNILKKFLVLFFLVSNIFATPRVAVVLGGGGSRGLAHIGVLEVLQENNIPIDLIVGCSMGSIIGAMYADNQDIARIKNNLFGTKFDDWVNKSIIQTVKLKSPLQFDGLESKIQKIIHARTFEELKIPFVAATTDINEGEIYPIASGDLWPAVKASASLPPLFGPVEKDGRYLVDGGVMSPVPVSIARQYNPQIVIAVDVSTKPLKKRDSFNLFNLTKSTMSLLYLRISKLEVASADVGISPDLPYRIFDEENYEKIYLEGRRAALEKIDEIKKLLEANS